MAVAPDAARAAIGSPRFSYGWVEVAVLFVTSMLIQGITLGGITLFDERLLNALHVSRSELKGRDSIFLLASATSCFLLGRVIEVLGVRGTMMLGLVALSVAMVIYSFVPPIWGLYLLHVLLGFSLSTAHVVLIMVVLSGWFPGEDPRRGMALGIAVSGASCGAVVMAQVIAWGLGHLFWTDVFRLLAVLPLALLPVVWFLIRVDRPEARHQGRAGAGFLAAFGAVLRSRQAALLLLGVLPVFYVSACLFAHLVLLQRDQGLSLQAAAAGVSMVFFFGLIGKFGSGFVLKWLPLKVAWLIFMALMLAGSLMLWLLPGVAQLVAVSMIGLGWGACFPLTQLRIAAAFGGPNLARILGLFVVIESFGSASGAWLTALMFDASHGYALPLGVNVLLLAVGWVVSLLTPSTARTSEE